MPSLKLTIGFSICISACLSTASYARKIEDWPYDRLFKEADIVVIASARGSGAFEEEWPEKVFEKGRFEGVDTIFHSRSVLKGTAPQRIHVIHFKYKQEARRYNDGPILVSFSDKPALIEVRPRDDGEGGQQELKRLEQTLTEEPEYLLFLKKRKDGSYEAVSGQMDAALSVRVLIQPRPHR